MYRLLARWRERERERLNRKKDCEEGVKLPNMREDTGIDQKKKKNHQGILQTTLCTYIQQLRKTVLFSLESSSYQNSPR